MAARLQTKLLLSALLLWAMPAVAETSPPPCALPVIRTAIVTKVDDDATLTLDDGESVRLIGVLPVRIFADTTSAGAQKFNELGRAAVELLRASLVGRQVRLARQGRERDRYDRQLAHVFAGDEGWLQGLLLERGLARAYSYGDNRACIEEMLRLEGEARQARKGLWRYRAMLAMDAADVDRIHRSKFRFALIEGRVHKVAALRKWTFVNFSEDWKHDFTIAIAGDRAREMQAEGFDPASLEGKRIRVRGIIESWNGPAIKLTHKEQVELLKD